MEKNEKKSLPKPKKDLKAATHILKREALRRYREKLRRQISPEDISMLTERELYPVAQSHLKMSKSSTSKAYNQINDGIFWHVLSLHNIK